MGYFPTSWGPGCEPVTNPRLAHDYAQRTGQGECRNSLLQYRWEQSPHIPLHVIPVAVALQDDGLAVALKGIVRHLVVARVLQTNSYRAVAREGVGAQAVVMRAVITGGKPGEQAASIDVLGEEIQSFVAVRDRVAGDRIGVTVRRHDAVIAHISDVVVLDFGVVCVPEPDPVQPIADRVAVHAVARAKA